MENNIEKPSSITQPTRLLLVEDRAADVDLAIRAIRTVIKDCEFHVVENRKDFLEALNFFQPDVILSDYSLPQFDGMKALQLALEHAPLTPLIIWTGSISEDVAVSCMKAGANNYVLKDNLKRLGPAVVHAIEEKEALVARQKAEEQLKAERNLLRTLIDNLPDLIYVLDTEGRKTLSNTADWRAAGGKTMQDVIGKTDFDTYPPELAEEFWETNQAVLEAGQPIIDHEELGRGADGSLVSFLTTKVPLRDSAGQIIGLMGISHDITERKQVEARINDLLALNEKILDHSPLGILTYKLTGECIYANTSAAAIIGAQVENLQAQNFHAIQSWKQSGLYDLVQQAITTQAPVTGDIHHISTFHKDLWLTVHCVMFKSKGEDHLLLFLSDITERKRAEEALRESENRLIMALSGAQMSVWEWNLQTNQILWSPEIFEITGVREHDSRIKFESFTHLIHAGDIQRVMAAAQKAMTEGILFAEEFRITRPDGEVRWLSNLGHAEYDSSGHHLRLIGTVQDITGRKRAEELLRQSETRFSSAFEYASIGMALVTPEGKWLRVNRALCNLLGYSEAELLARTFQDITHPDDLETDLNYVHQVLTGEINSYQMEKRYFHKSGRVVWALLSVSLVQESENKPLYFISQIQDITERKQAEEALRASEIRFRTFVNHATDAFFLHDEDEQGRILDVNRQACESLGYSREELIRLTPHDFDLDLDPVLLEQRRVRLIAGETLTFDTRHRRKDGTVFPVEVRIRSFEEGGRHFSLSLVHDITERKQAEAALQESITRFRTFVNHATDAFFLHDERGKVLDVNNQACESLGYSREELIGSHPFSFDPDLTPATLEQLLTRLSTEEMIAFDTHHRRKDGTVFPVEVRIRSFEEGGRRFSLSLVHDITNRKRAETALLESSLQFHVLFEASPDAILLIDPNNNWSITDCNTAACQMNGYSREELIGQSIDFLNAEPAGLYEREEYLERIRKHNGVLRYETSHRRKDGTTVIVEVSTTLIRFGKRDMVLGIDRDITQRKKSDMEVQRQMAELEALYENGLAVGQLLKPAEIGNRVIETFARYLSWHHVAIRLRRENSDDLALVAFNLPTLKDEERSAAEQHFIARVNKVGQGLSGWVIQTGVPLRTGNVHAHPQYIGSHAGIQSGLYMPLKIGERIIGVISVESELPDAFNEQDERLLATLANQAAIAFENARLYQTIRKELTERERAEAALRASETHYRELADSITDILFELDHDLRYTHWNKASEVFSGIPAEKAIGKSMREIWGASQEQAGREEIYKSVLKDRQPRTFEIEAVIQGQKRALEISAYPSMRGVSVVAKDVTERKQMEQALETERNQLAQRVEERTADLSRANVNLARALRVKDEFLANMSHELRTPLNAILGLSESLGEQIAGPLNEKQQKYITTISESGHHLLSLINDILDLAKIEAGQITLDKTKMDIRSVCQASLRMVKQLAQKKNQEVSLEIEEGLGLMWADERRLKQMIVNLLSNAVKFTPENGRLGVEVYGDKAANKITITVWDNGIGITQEDLARLFQPFVQLDSGLAREAPGTGLGLALVAQMARLHGGSVTAVSKPGEGSRFSIVLPWEPALTRDTVERLRNTGKLHFTKPDQTRKPLILLVEDTPEVTLLLKDYMELAGFSVVTAEDGVEALKQARLVHPDLVLMDIQLPRMDGLETTRRLRAEPDFKYTPIVALTALAMPSDRERCLAAGVDEYISKPVHLKALVKIIQDCLFNNHEESQSQ